AREPALRSPCRCCEPRSPVTPAWPPSPRPASRTGRVRARSLGLSSLPRCSGSLHLFARDRVKERAGDATAAAAGDTDRASLRIGKLDQRLVAAGVHEGCVMKFVSANDRFRRSDRTVCPKTCLPVAEMQLALGEARGVSKQAGHRIMYAVRIFYALAEDHVAAALAVHRPRLCEARESGLKFPRSSERAGMQFRITAG